MTIICGDGEYCSVTMASRILGVSTQTVKRWDKHGILKPTVTLSGGTRVYSREDLDKFIETRNKKGKN